MHQQSNKHRLGLDLGIISREMRLNDNLSLDVDSLYGIGVGYSYFSNGINKRGATYGISVHTPLKEDYFGEEVIF